MTKPPSTEPQNNTSTLPLVLTESCRVGGRAPFLLVEGLRVSRSPAPSSAIAWDYDVIHDGLLSGKISGRRMAGGDAKLLIGLLERLGWVPDPHQLAGVMPYFVASLDPQGLRDLMRRLGYSSRLQRRRGRELTRKRVCVAVVDGYANLWALDESGPGLPKLSRSGTDAGAASTRTLAPGQIYEVIEFTPLPDVVAVDRPAARTGFTFETMSGLAPDLRLALLLTLYCGILTVAFSLAVIFLFNLVVSGQQSGVIVAVLVAAAGLFLADLVFRALKARLLGRVAGRFEFLLGQTLFDKLLHLPRRMIDEAPLSEQTARLRELENLRDIFAGPFAILALELPVTIVLLVAIALISPSLAALIVTIICVFVLAALCMVPRLILRASQLANMRSALVQLQHELIDKRDTIARNGLAWPWAEKAGRTINAVAEARFRLSITGAVLEALSYVCLPLTAATVIFYGAQQVIAGQVSGGELIAVTMLTWRAIAPIQQSLLILPKIGDVTRLFRQLDAMVRLPSDEDLPNLQTKNDSTKTLTAENIFLRGPSAPVPTLAGVSLEIPPGCQVAVTGASGAGKSVLLGVLAGQIRPQAGTVQFGGINLSELSSHALGRRIVLVPQRPLFIYGTLAQNLRFVNPLVSDEQIERVLTEVGLGQLLSRLPSGIHSRIDPSVDHILFYGGVRTAVAVAQALLIEPAMLLLDEASDDVDPEIDRAMRDAIGRRREKMATLFVTHRPSAIRAADAVLQISAGRARLSFTSEKKDIAV